MVSGPDFPDVSALPGTLAYAVPGWGEYLADEVMPLASVGKLLLLASVAQGFVSGELDPGEPLGLLEQDFSAGSGLLVTLSPRRWTLLDLARLTAAVSDNTATNALLRRVGVERVAADAGALGLERSRVLDRIREPRLAGHPPAFAVGTAREVAALAAVAAGDRGWGAVLLGWMAGCLDRSMVAAGIAHDPEDSVVRDVPLSGLWVANKTGTDVGTRCDVGVVRGARQVCYAVLTRCAAGREFDMVLAMRDVGAVVGRLAGAGGSASAEADG
ncbi:Beta-lactamase class A-like protein [Catenulispora acidiphila DSM 44928]|uniref:Beta-lactamase class A-like protein n=1 Tax=Catenulispora acidiphila (strain DSM 44928 / JCM 14897 / NBRC 102108 / NRRL B-24433 / ID139908) TaxID=479433 RepID=C7Q1Q4_CATAD|nr:Beta-lactamase class A-like protein [Catenulispora acidiphila DSM 44928]